MTLIPIAEAERADFADLLRTLTPEQWAAPSLCRGWRVRDVVTHVVSYDELGPRRVAGLLVRGGLHLGRVNAMALHALDRLSTDELLATFERHRRPTGLTAGFGGRIGLADALVHQQDVRRPLGLPRTVPPERLRPVLDFVLRSPALPAWRLARGLRLVATDLGWTHGDGPLVQGSGEALLMAVTGRGSALADCSGPGVARLAGRRPLG